MTEYNHPLGYRKTYRSGQRVRCNGTGRIWVKELEGKTGTILGECKMSNEDLICFDDGERVSLYCDEYDTIEE